MRRTRPVVILTLVVCLLAVGPRAALADVFVGELTIAPGGTFEVGNDRVVTSTSGLQVESYITDGRIVSEVAGTYNNGSWRIGWADHDLGTRVGFAAAGDTDLDGEFRYSDFIAMIVSGKYNTGQPAQWQQGDFNYDGEFNYRDILDVILMNAVEGIYNTGPYEGPPVPAPEVRMTSLHLIPEPSALLLLGLGSLASGRCRRGRARQAAPPRRARIW